MAAGPCEKEASVAVPSWQCEGASCQGPVWCSGSRDAVRDGRPSSEGLGSKGDVGQTQ